MLTCMPSPLWPSIVLVTITSVSLDTKFRIQRVLFLSCAGYAMMSNFSASASANKKVKAHKTRSMESEKAIVVVLSTAMSMSGESS